MSTPYLGQITYFAFGFPPKGWLLCNGQLMAINQNQALFSLLGTTYGGNGIQTFALPNIQGRVALGVGGSYQSGMIGGEETHVLTAAELPSHSHMINVDASTPGSSNTVTPGSGTVLGAATSLTAPNPAVNLYSAASPAGQLAGQSVTPTGSGSHENRMPYLVLSACIAVSGIFPSRN